MKASYDDIRSRISEAPKWFDSNGVPRYDQFDPRLCPNIYADEVLLLRIACQACGERFSVEMHCDHLRRIMRPERKAFSEQTTAGSIPHFGDPPRHGGCSGETMNCEDLRVEEFWQRNEATRREWTRRADLEVCGEDAA
jgi:hypothetical protein